MNPKKEILVSGDNILKSTARDSELKSFIENNTQWVIDYKTPFLPIKNLNVEAKKHYAQLRKYEGLYKVNKLSIQKAIYFPPQGKLIKL